MSRKRAEAEGVPAHELMVWTRRFAAMIDVGVSLVRSLAVLAEEESTPRMQDLTRLVMARIEAGATLSEALYALPTQQEIESGRFAEEFQRGGFEEATLAQFERLQGVFDEDYLATVRVGEVGGILDVALERQVTRYERGLLPLPRVKGGALPRAELAEWFWRFGAMLKAGVPLLYALETLKRVSRPPLDRISWEMRDEIAAGGSFAPEQEGEQPTMWRYPGIFTPTVRALAATDPEALLRLASLLEDEAQWEAEGLLPPLDTSALSGRPSSAKELKEEHPIVREVNDLFKAAIEKGAQWVTLEPAEGGTGEATLTKGGDTLATIALSRYEQVVRRIKVIADIDPFAQDDRRSQIHLSYEDRRYLLSVHSRPAAGGGRLALGFGERDGTVEL
jgi:hypothetical protein